MHSEIVDVPAQDYDHKKQKKLSPNDYLERCSMDSRTYNSAAERMAVTIGRATLRHSGRDSISGCIFMNRTVKVAKQMLYPRRPVAGGNAQMRSGRFPGPVLTCPNGGKPRSEP